MYKLCKATEFVMHLHFATYAPETLECYTLAAPRAQALKHSSLAENFISPVDPFPSCPTFLDRKVDKGQRRKVQVLQHRVD